MLWFTDFHPWLYNVISIGTGAFLGAYLRKKGENLATQEDIQKLVEQVRATTEATKAIEARIEGAVWDRQKQWEMKRDALVAAVEPLSRADDMLIRLTTAYANARDNTQRDPEAVQKFKTAATLEFQKEINLFDERRRVLALICSRNATSAFHRVSKELRSTASLTLKDRIEGYGDVARPIQEAIALAFIAARAELGFAVEEDFSAVSNPPDDLPSSQVRS